MSDIRKYKATDLKDIFEIYKRARKSECFIEATVENLESFQSLIEDEDIYLASVDGKSVAFIAVYSEQSFIHHLYVLPEYQNRGLGTALVDFIRNKYELPLSLKCELQNEPAIAFYMKSGWKKFKKASEIDGTAYILMTLDFD